MGKNRDDGYTRIYDDVVRMKFVEETDRGLIVRSLGLMGAAVFGIVWRHTLMRDGDCHCSTKTMGELLGISRRSARRWLVVLQGMGLIVQTQPANPDESEPPHYICAYTPIIERNRKYDPVDRESIALGTESP